MNGCSFQEVLWQHLSLFFFLTHGNSLFQRFPFKVNNNSIGSSKNGTWYFQNSPLFEKSACFDVTIIQNFQLFQYTKFQTFSEKRKPFSKSRHLFLLESTKIENVTFPCKPSYKQFICCTKYPNDLIHTFRKYSNII